MAVSKIMYDGVGIDLTNDTATESDVASGKYFHKADGTRVQGTATIGGTATFPGNVTITFDTSQEDDIPYAYRAASSEAPTNVVWAFGLYDPDDPQDVMLDIVAGVGGGAYDGFYVYVHDNQEITATNAVFLHCNEFIPDESLAQYGIAEDYNVYYVIPTASTCTITVTDGE